jgi:hypothetical protein
MFFLHDLDLTREMCLPEVLPKDDLKVLQSLGVTLTTKKTVHKSLDPDMPSEMHPLGEAPMWADVEQCIKEEPWKLMKTWEWSEEGLGSLNQMACRLFQKFTTQVWTCLNSRWRTDQRPIRPVGLWDALKCWTLDEVHAQIRSVSFVACNAGLQGSVPGRRMPSFSDRRSLYFPAASEDLAGYWQLLSIDPGYIAEYQDICAKLTLQEIEELNYDLGILLSECQCLPQSTRTSETTSGTQQVIWKGKDGKIQILTNPSFYKLRCISNSTRRSNVRAPPTHTPTKTLQTFLLEQAGISKEVARKTVNWSRTLQKAAYAKGNRSGKAKNRRAPPQRKKHGDPVRDDVDNSYVSDDSAQEASEVNDMVKRKWKGWSQKSRRIVLSDLGSEDLGSEIRTESEQASEESMDHDNWDDDSME